MRLAGKLLHKADSAVKKSCPIKYNNNKVGRSQSNRELSTAAVCDVAQKNHKRLDLHSRGSHLHFRLFESAKMNTERWQIEGNWTKRPTNCRIVFSQSNKWTTHWSFSFFYSILHGNAARVSYAWIMA